MQNASVFFYTIVCNFDMCSLFFRIFGTSFITNKNRTVLQLFSHLLGHSPQFLPLSDVVILYNRMTVKGP